MSVPAVINGGSRFEHATGGRCRLTFCDVGTHELPHDLGGRTILGLTRFDKRASQHLVDSEFECNVLSRHGASVPIVDPNGYPKTTHPSLR